MRFRARRVSAGGKLEVQTTISSADLTSRFQDVHEQRMQGLPFINEQLEVEAVGFREFQDFEIGVLITPWFMNLILLPAADVDSGIDQGHRINACFPSGDIEFTAAQDEELGLYFSAVLFSTVADIPDHTTAREIAAEVMKGLFESKEHSQTLSRRSLFTTAGHTDA
jgi:[NiFe] hydrogenase assembly HybE family chaperone